MIYCYLVNAHRGWSVENGKTSFERINGIYMRYVSVGRSIARLSNLNACPWRGYCRIAMHTSHGSTAHYLRWVPFWYFGCWNMETNRRSYLWCVYCKVCFAVYVLLTVVCLAVCALYILKARTWAKLLTLNPSYLCWTSSMRCACVIAGYEPFGTLFHWFASSVLRPRVGAFCNRY